MPRNCKDTELRASNYETLLAIARDQFLSNPATAFSRAATGMPSVHTKLKKNAGAFSIADNPKDIRERTIYSCKNQERTGTEDTCINRTERELYGMRQ